MLRLFHQTRPTQEDIHYTVLLDDLERTKRELEHVYAAFSNVTEPDLIDAYIYQLNSAQLRYRFLLNSVKEYK
ncbi:MAG: YaaL family protein [Eubacterium sp.]|nr:YaaL family protein [Eubacterium sp.]